MSYFTCGFSVMANMAFVFFLSGVIAGPAAAEPTFISFDRRLPNPDQPYVMTSGTIVYDIPSLFDFQFWATNLSQMDVPSPVSGGYEFESTFDVAFETVMSFGLEPPHKESGIGTAHVRGFAPGGTEPVFVFNTELLSLDLVGTSPGSGGFMLRESPMQQSTGVTRVFDRCFNTVCPAIPQPLEISSFLDVFTEISITGGVSWTPARDNEVMHLVQLPEPSAIGLVALCAAGVLSQIQSRTRLATRNRN